MKNEFTKNKDILSSAVAANGQLRASAVSARAMAEYAKDAHGLSPVAAVALGRLLCAGSLMSLDLKGAKESLTISIKCDGPIEGLSVCANSDNMVKGYCDNSVIMLAGLVNSPRISVSDAVGKGILTVTKDLGLKQPFTGQVDLVSGEIAEDLTHYFAVSEQTPSAVALGVLLDFNEQLLLKLATSSEISSSTRLTDCYNIAYAGGFIIRAMPGATDETLDRLEAHIKKLAPVTSMLAKGLTPKDILNHILKPFDPLIVSTSTTGFACDCSRESMLGVLKALDKKELGSLPIETVCPYCSKKYVFEELD